MSDSKVGRVQNVQTVGISDVPEPVTEYLPADSFTAVELRVSLPKTRGEAYAAWPDGVNDSTLDPYLDWYEINEGELIDLVGRDVRVREVGNYWFVVPIRNEKKNEE